MDFYSSSVINAQTLTRYVKQKQQEIAAKQRVEKQKYEQACQKGTLEALKSYVKAYPKGKYINEINKRIEDFDLWRIAKRDNTVASFKKYLNESKYKIFEMEAMAAIDDLNAIAEWQNVKSTEKLSAVEEYMHNHPNVSIIDEVKRKKHELTGLQLFNKGDLANAYLEFKAAGGYFYLDSSTMSAYNKCQEFHDFSLLNSTSKVSELSEFLSKYPNSEYRNKVSNWIAVGKAKELTMFSGDYSYKEALSYAKDEQTKNIVGSYYDIRKRDYAQYKKQLRRANRIRNGGIVNLGIEVTDLAINLRSDDYYDTDIDFTMYYNLGVSIKIGNFRSPVQFEIGAKPGVVAYTLRYNGDEENKTAFHLPIYARLKVNVYDGNDSKWYIDGVGYYNAVKESLLEGDYSASVGVGIAWRHWDWRILYYKQDISPKETYSDYKFLGTSFYYYF